MNTLSRRQLLRLGGGALVAGLAAGHGWATPEDKEMRIGAVLPMRTGMTPIGGQTSYIAAADAAHKGIIMGGEEYARNAALLNRELKVLVATAPDEDAARRAAARMIASEGVFSLVSGFGTEQTRILSELAAERQVPFFNIAASGDVLRGENCNRYTFHVEASAAMYLDAMAAWFVHAGLRRHFFVVADTPEQQAQYERMRRALSDQHFGAEEVGRAEVSGERPLFTNALQQIETIQPDIVVLMLDVVGQLDFLGQFESFGLDDILVTGFPSAMAQTRAFYAASRNASATVGSGFRAALFEASIDNYGARELNARFLDRWNQPMDPSAWAGYQSVKMLYEAALMAQTMDGGALIEHLEDPRTSFDVHKGIGVSFRPWDHQLRQPIYLVQINSEAESAEDLASLAGELPEIRKPGTDPIERLDQIGDLPGQSKCEFN